ncbi:MAG: GWxTD domain-containing protein, partial [Bacteroidales bacterium]|nr:GWxTD domain-containing protein [Bacteroidales bacterium]
GFETDRGVIFLQYGMPNHIFQSQIEPGAYPYEIWQYYRIGEENNCKFVFYNPSLVGENFELLHSNKLGELKTFNWTRYLTRSKSMSYGDSDIYNSTSDAPDGYKSTTRMYDWERRAIEEFNK